MIAIDTNVLLRYIVEDDPAQSATAIEFMENRLSAASPGFVTLVALAELFWVLRRGYRFTQADIVSVIDTLLNSPQVIVEQAAVVETILASPHADLGDLLIHVVGKANGCSRTVTFDTMFARQAGVELLS